jgi:hypothetical protein
LELLAFNGGIGGLIAILIPSLHGQRNFIARAPQSTFVPCWKNPPTGNAILA